MHLVSILIVHMLSSLAVFLGIVSISFCVFLDDLIHCFVQTERVKRNDTGKHSETGENVHDEDRDQAHLVLRRKCEILSCNMAMFGGDAVIWMHDTSTWIEAGK